MAVVVLTIIIVACFLGYGNKFLDYVNNAVG